VNASVSREIPEPPEAAALFGWSVVITRPAGRTGAFVVSLEQQGATALLVPTIAVVDPQDGGASLRQAAGRLGEFDWVVFTSQNAVDRLVDAVADPSGLREVRVAAIGEGTSEALARRGVVAELVPSQYVGEALVERFPATDRGGKVLLPRASVARDVVPEGLRRLGWDVEVVEAYTTLPAEITASSLEAVRTADAITFTSSSTVLGFLRGARVEDLPPVVGSIGPVTTETANEAGIEVSVEAEVHTSLGLVRALVAFARAHGRPDRRSTRPS
jgi:uroporphyrinogen-III synthase